MKKKVIKKTDVSSIHAINDVVGVEKEVKETDEEKEARETSEADAKKAEEKEVEKQAYRERKLEKRAAKKKAREEKTGRYAESPVVEEVAGEEPEVEVKPEEVSA